MAAVPVDAGTMDTAMDTNGDKMPENWMPDNPVPDAPEQPTVYTVGQVIKKNRWLWDPSDHDEKREEPIVKIDDMDDDQVKLALIRARMNCLNLMIKAPMTYDGAAAREPSPEPIYDANGSRMNKRETRIRNAIKTEQQALVETAVELTGTGAINRKHDARVNIPVDKYPDYNFKGVLIGPRGMNMKRLEQETGCRIAVRGKGMRKRKDGLDMPGDELPLHVLIETWDKEKLAPAVEHVKKLLVPAAPEAHAKQLRELAILNGTYREGIKCENCGEEGHKLYQCPKREKAWKAANVTCELCGANNHLSRDCPHANGMAAGAAPVLDNEYDDFMKELTGEDTSGSRPAAATPGLGARPSVAPSPGGKGRPGLGYAPPPAAAAPPGEMLRIQPPNFHPPPVRPQWPPPMPPGMPGARPPWGMPAMPPNFNPHFRPRPGMPPPYYPGMPFPPPHMHPGMMRPPPASPSATAADPNQPTNSPAQPAQSYPPQQGYPPAAQSPQQSYPPTGYPQSYPPQQNPYAQ